VSLMRVEKVPDSTYETLGGLEKQVKEIKEVIELPIKHPEIFESLGISQPKGVLLYGPPGTGKTLLARAVAHHTDCCFIRVSGSELVQKYIGEGSRMVRELFVMARESAPSIIFMDEVDSIGSSRIEGESGGDSEVQRTMLELLNQLDGFESASNIKVLMATNRLDILDDALIRPGRIDRKIEFPNPNEAARADILKIHSRKMNLMRSVACLPCSNPKATTLRSWGDPKTGHRLCIEFIFSRFPLDYLEAPLKNRWVAADFEARVSRSAAAGFSHVFGWLGGCDALLLAAIMSPTFDQQIRENTFF